MKKSIKRFTSLALAFLMVLTACPLSGICLRANAASNQYAIFPMDFLNVSQTYSGTTSHKPHTNGNIVDYPIDICGKDTGQDVFKAPFDLKIVNVYTTGTNTFWFESLNDVYCADGTLSKVCGQVTHPNDIDMPRKDAVYHQGDIVSKEGTNGCSGNHIHLSLGKGSITNNGWKKNSNGKWVLTCTGGTFKPENILYVTDAINVKYPNGISWKKIDATKDYYVMRSCDKLMEANESTVIVRSGPAKTYNQIDTIPFGKEIRAVGYYVNYHGNVWYKVEYDGQKAGQISWIYSERLKDIPIYKITYNVNGGKGAPASQNKKKNAEVTISKTLPTRDKFQFVGWSSAKVKDYYTSLDDAQAQVNYNPGDKYSTNKNLTLYAVWHETKTSVSLSSNKVDLCLDDNKTATVNVTIKGVVNSGYKVELSTVDKVTAKASTISISKLSKLRTLSHIENNLGTAKITLTAKEKGPTNLYVYIKDTKGKIVANSGISINVTKKYNITYNANGGTGAPAKQIKISGQNQYLSSNVPTYTNKTFLGWAVSGSNEIKYGPGDIYNIDADVTLVAQWGQNYYIKPVPSEDGKVLTIKGHGDMPCYGLNNYKTSKWYQYASTVEKIIIISDGDGQVTSIGSYAFAGFNKLTSVEMPTTVSRIHSYAFYNCGSLRSVLAPENVILGSYAFANCGKLSDYKKTSTKKSAPAKASVMSVESSTGSIGAFAFENCVNLQSIDISDVSSVGESAFSGCTSLNDIRLSDDLNIIEDCAFYNCSDLTEIDIPNEVTEISDGAFSGCSSLDEIDLSDNIDTIGEQAFSGCTSIENVEIPESIEFIGSSAFANCTSLETVDLPDNTFCLSDSMFSGCTSLQSISIPNSVMNLGDGTFLGCTGLKNIEIPESVGEIGDNTFAYCKSLTSIDIPDSVSVIKDFAFYGCTGLKDIDFSINLDSIGTCAFANCTALQSISLPGSLSTINDAAFADCTSLKNVDFEESMISIADEAFSGCTSLEIVKIPECASYVSNTAFNNCSNKLSVSCYSTSDVYDQLTNSGVSYNTIYPVEGLKLTGSKTFLKKGETLQLNPIFTPSNATNKSVRWFSHNEDVASVSNNGVVTAQGSGNAIIVAVTDEGNYEAIYEVNCTIPVEKITVNDNFENCFVGDETYILYSLNPENPTYFDLLYKSSNKNVATVDEDGLLSIVGTGEAVIEISSADGNAKTSFKINAKEFIHVNDIKLNINSIDLKVSDTAKLSATVLPSNATNKYVYFYSENEDIATVDQDGNIKAIKEGSTKIVCINDEIETVCLINVKAGQKTVKSVSVSDVSINYKASTKITPVINAESGTKYTVEYSSSNNSVATIDKNGNVYGGKRGNATITCTVTDEFRNQVSDTCKVTVGYAWWQWIIKIVLFGWIWY